MDAFRLSALFTICVCLMRFEITDGICNKNMTDYCGSRITMYDDHQLVLYYNGSKRCEVTIATSSQFPNLMLYFQSFAASCKFGYVTIRTPSVYESLGVICGDVSLSTVYTANGDVNIKYTPTILRWASFSFVVTLYSDLSHCPSNGYVCANKRCIDANLKCNGYNSCGGNSECWTYNTSSTGDNSGCRFNSSKSDHSSTGGNSGIWTSSTKSNDNSASNEGIVVDGVDGVGIGIGVAAGVIVLIVVSILIICCRRRRTETPAQRARPSAPPMQVVYSTHDNSVQSNDQSPPPYNPAWAVQSNDQSPPPYNPAWASNPQTNETRRPDTHTHEPRRSRCCSIGIECAW